MSRQQYIYAFGEARTEGSGELAALLGGKGAGLAEMSHLGIPVPPGFTLTTEVCRYYHAHGRSYPSGLDAELHSHVEAQEEALGRGFGRAPEPLLFSVRSGGAVSMPGMMDTVLNLGLNRALVEELSTDERNARFYRDCYRRLLMMYGDVVLGRPAQGFERILHQERDAAGNHSDHDLPVAALDRVITRFEEYIAEDGSEFPQDPFGQLWGAIGAVFGSWHNRRAREYRRLHGISEEMGTAVNVQVMVFGNRGEDCATGVAFTRNPADGSRELYGEYLVNAQGEDLVAGTHTPLPIESNGEHPGLRDRFPEAHARLEEVCQVLERHFHNMQDVEFTIEHETLFMLQTRAGKRTGPAAVRIAVDMARERLINRREALRRVEPDHLVQMMAPVFDPRQREKAIADGRLLGRGLGAGPGAASGRIAFSAERATEMAADGPVLLVRNETSPEDIVGMHASAGILTTRGGMTSHAAVVARGLGRPCIVGAGGFVLDEEGGEVRVADRVLREGDQLSIDGSRGEVIAGALEARPSEVLEVLLGGDDAQGTASPAVESFLTVLRWADGERRLRVRANADTPDDARVARTLGAEGIGLCRTEHMFFAEDRIGWVREMILARDTETRERALAKLLPVQQSDFEGIFRALSGLPVTIRLLDPPLHEFLPKGGKALARLAEQMGIGLEELEDKVEALVEANPMLGNRGCRLGITAPEIYDMQVEAIVRAAHVVSAEGIEPHPEIMVPLVGVEEELSRLRRRIEEVVARVSEQTGASLDIPVGTMIEVPRAALTANRVAQHADFFSFGTNDLTQMTYGYSRDDVGRFLPQYLEGEVLPWDPFSRLDVEGVGQLVEIASRRGRMARPGLKLGVCGEHGGEPHSIDFFERCQLDYVSCSPYRVPVARLAAARAHLAHFAYRPGARTDGVEEST